MKDEAKFIVRMPPYVHYAIKKSAKKANTSMNRHVVNMLIDQLDQPPVEKQLAKINRTLAKMAEK